MRRLQVILSVLFLSIILTGCGKNSYKAGVENLENGQYEEAAENFKEAVEKEKNTADAYRGMGIALWESEDYEGAKEAFLNALEKGTKKNATLYSFLGNCELKLDNPENALEYYEQGLAAGDAGAELTQEIEFNQIAAYEKMKDMKSAKAKLQEYIEKYPQDEAAAKEAEFLETR